MQPGENASGGQWWLNPANVKGLVQGVFEGGGAKGLLYVGALKGLLMSGLSFSAVAGSSAALMCATASFRC